jgi:hypothetical protein
MVHSLANPEEVDAFLKETLGKRIEALEAALKPFAEAAENIDNPLPDNTEILEHPDAMCITAGDLRCARKLLQGE